MSCLNVTTCEVNNVTYNVEGESQGWLICEIAYLALEMLSLHVSITSCDSLYNVHVFGHHFLI